MSISIKGNVGYSSMRQQHFNKKVKIHLECTIQCTGIYTNPDAPNRPSIKVSFEVVNEVNQFNIFH